MNEFTLLYFTILILGLWNLAKKSLPATNRNKKMFAGYLAKFMLHCKWKNLDGFKLFMKYAGKLYSGVVTSDYQSQVLRCKKMFPMRFNEFSIYFHRLLDAWGAQKTDYVCTKVGIL